MLGLLSSGFVQTLLRTNCILHLPLYWGSRTKTNWSTIVLGYLSVIIIIEAFLTVSIKVYMLVECKWWNKSCRKSSSRINNRGDELICTQYWFFATIWILQQYLLLMELRHRNSILGVSTHCVLYSCCICTYQKCLTSMRISFRLILSHTCIMSSASPCVPEVAGTPSNEHKESSLSREFYLPYWPQYWQRSNNRSQRSNNRSQRSKQSPSPQHHQ